MSEYYTSIHGEQFGPLTLDELYGWLDSKRISALNWIWLPDSQDWFLAIMIPGIAEYFYNPGSKPPSPHEKTTSSLPNLNATTLIYSKDNLVPSGTDADDNRKSLRLSTSLNITFCKFMQNLGIASEMEYSGDTIDISNGGCSFISPVLFDLGTTLKIEFPLIGIQAMGKVIRCAEVKVANSSEYHLGIKFTKMESDYQQIMDTFILDHFE